MREPGCVDLENCLSKLQGKRKSNVEGHGIARLLLVAVQDKFSKCLMLLSILRQKEYNSELFITDAWKQSSLERGFIVARPLEPFGNAPSHLDCLISSSVRFYKDVY